MIWQHDYYNSFDLDSIHFGEIPLSEKFA